MGAPRRRRRRDGYDLPGDAYDVRRFGAERYFITGGVRYRVRNTFGRNKPILRHMRTGHRIIFAPVVCVVSYRVTVHALVQCKTRRRMGKKTK